MDIRISKEQLKEKRQPRTDKYIWRKERSGRNKAVGEESSSLF